MSQIEFQLNSTKVNFKKINSEDIEINIGDFFKHISGLGAIGCNKNIKKNETTYEIVIYSAQSTLIVSEYKFLGDEIAECDLTKPNISF